MRLKKRCEEPRGTEEVVNMGSRVVQYTNWCGAFLCVSYIFLPFLLEFRLGGFVRLPSKHVYKHNSPVGAFDQGLTSDL